ncbi:MAG: hypothetical protein IMZ62_01945, partial [Chloroflexi bacterium]|nr:hypothetical protein [Chloroflexota bacterium]
MPDPTNSFLRDFVSLGEGTEVPPIFLLWSGIAGISAALERRCWIDQGSYIVYPNIYMILIAGSGRCRKSTAIGLIENLLIKVEPPINILPDS